MKIVLVTESPNKLRRVFQSAAERVWPEHEISHLLTWRFGPYRFAYPRGIPWRKYPHLSLPAYRWEGEFKAQPDRDELERRLWEADRIVCACDSDHSGVTPFERLLDLSLGEARQQKEVLYAYIPDYREASVDTALYAAIPDSSLHQRLHRYGLAKSYFDYNFNANSAAVLGRTLRAAGLEPGEELLSKFQVQALYFLRERGETKENDLIRHFAHWKGTGKYLTGSAHLGNPASYAGILEGMVRGGLVERSTVRQQRSEESRARLAALHPEGERKIGEFHERHHLLLSPAGERFLALLHPGCQDADLPFRLSAWMIAGLEETKSAMDRYLRTWFGRQIRFLSRATRHPA